MAEKMARLRQVFGRTRRIRASGLARRVGLVGRLTWRVGYGLVIFLALYYGLVPLFVQNIDDDADFMADISVEATQSRAVAVVTGLIRREIDDHGWTANDPWFFPTAALDNMPNYQLGMFAGISRFVIELGDQIGRARGSSKIDQDVEDAAGRMKYPGTVWYLDFGVSWVPTAPAESQYRKAALALQRYGERLSRGEAVFERRADNMLAALERVLSDSGSDSARIDEAVDRAWLFPLGWQNDDLFYRVKGRMYANYLILSALGEDFKKLIADREMQTLWTQMLASLRKGATLNPLVVLNGSPDQALFMNHLTGLGFYLLRARTQMKEVTNTLLK